MKLELKTTRILFVILMKPANCTDCRYWREYQIVSGIDNKINAG